VSDALRSVHDLDDVLTVLLGVAFDILAPERGLVLLRNPHTGELDAAVVHPEDARPEFSRTILEHAVSRRATLVVRDVEEDERFRGVPSLQLNQTRGVVCCPLISHGDVVGAICLDTTFEGIEARREEVGLLNFIACYAATAIENALLLRERSRARTLDDLDEEPLVAQSPAMASVAAELENLANRHAPVVIEGEPGTGKLLAARHLHLHGPGSSAPFLALDCAQLPGRDFRQLLTGTAEQPAGVWQETIGGTLVLEHVGALDLLAQNDLAGLLESGDPATPRLVVTSTRGLSSLTSLSERLQSALGSERVELPRLRERREDVVPLARHFLARAPGEEARRELSESAESTLVAARYKERNVTELRDAIELAVVLSDSGTIEAEHVFTGPRSRQHRLEFDLGSGSVVRWLLRRKVQAAFALGTTAIFAGLITCCLALPEHAVGKLANGLVWGLWWPALLLVFLLAGRLWCTWCPLSRVARWGQSLWSLSRRPPAWLKRNAHWLMALLFVAIVWSEHVFHMPERPVATGIFLVSLIVLAVAAAAVTKGEVWCRFACPLGNMSACYSVPATMHVHANPMICQSQCKTHECYKGTPEEAGCPVFLHPLYVKDSHFCKMCMACVRNCPNDSAKLWIRPPLQDMWSLAELNPQLVPLALTIFLLAPLMLSGADDTLVYTGLTLLLFALVVPLRWLIHRSLTVDELTMPAVRTCFALALLAWGPLMAFHLANIPGLGAMHVHNEVHQASMITLPLLPTLQLLAIVFAGLAAGAVLGRIRAKAGVGRWWPVHLIVLLYLSISAWLVL
jgi:transcriptional regulator with AAA-type ATPase domain/polyferredoxin